MVKSIFILGLVLLCFNVALAQKRDTVVYYFTNAGRPTPSKEKSNYRIYVISPDKKIDKSLFIVKAYYNNGNLMFKGNSTSNTDLIFQGSYTGFYPNGQKMVEETYNKGKLVGDMISYYPNGKMYTKTTYSSDRNPFLSDCVDSAGNVLATNGNGKWIQFSNNFSQIDAEGQIVNGIKEGEWSGRVGSANFVWLYKNGAVVSSTKSTDSEKKEIVPEFPGGIEAFTKFVISNTNYPRAAKRNGTQGRVIVGFVIEKDGSLTDVKVQRGLGDGCDEEAVRVIKLSAPWKPGIQDGKAVRVAYSIPIAFTISN